MELDVTPLQKAREYVGNADQTGPVELLGLLREARNQKHPDRFLDPTAKAKAEEDFKKIQDLIAELDKFVQAQEAQLKPSEIALYKPSFQIASFERKVDALELHSSNLEFENKYLREKTDSLELQLREKVKTELQSEQNKIRELYRPKRGDLIKVGLLLAFSAIIPLFSKIEEVSVWVNRYSPFSPSYIDKTVFAAFLIVLVLAFKKLAESQFISNRSDLILAPSFASNFIIYIEALRSGASVSGF